MTAIGKLIKQVIRNNKEKKCDLAIRIAPEGATNIQKALRRLDKIIKEAKGLDECAERLRIALGVEDEIFNDAINDTREQIKLEKEYQRLKQKLNYRKNFKQHLFTLTEHRIPTQITMCGLTGGNKHRMIPLEYDDFEYLSVEKQFEFIRKVIAEHQKQKKGEVPFFGKVIAYWYRPTPDGDGMQFDILGQRMPLNPNNNSYLGRSIVCIK
jgi:hypothetical protein